MKPGILHLEGLLFTLYICAITFFARSEHFRDLLLTKVISNVVGHGVFD